MEHEELKENWDSTLINGSPEEVFESLFKIFGIVHQTGHLSIAGYKKLGNEKGELHLALARTLRSTDLEK